MTERPTRRTVRRRMEDVTPSGGDHPPEVTIEHYEVSLPNDAKVDANDPPTAVVDRGDASDGGDDEAVVRGPIGGFTANYDAATGDVTGSSWVANDGEDRPDDRGEP